MDCETNSCKGEWCIYVIKIEDDCVDCGKPCLGSGCPYHNVQHYYCDECEEEVQLYNYEGKQLCAECILNKYEALQR